MADLKDELQGYWELPAIAHFCSLFRMVFKFSEFDIETLEEAFLQDTISAGKNARCSLIMDTLICLLKGISGRREVSIDNYNRFFHRILFNQWESVGLGPNPLGPDVSKANFNALPLYVKVKLVYTLCEMRLQKNDVEHALREFSGGSMRVIPLGEDRNGVTYWYFYGTRLYMEDPEIKITIPLKRRGRKKRPAEASENEAEQPEYTPPRTLRSRKKKRRMGSYDYRAKKKKKPLAKAKLVPEKPLVQDVNSEDDGVAGVSTNDVQDNTGNESRMEDSCDGDSAVQPHGQWAAESATLRRNHSAMSFNSLSGEAERNGSEHMEEEEDEEEEDAVESSDEEGESVAERQSTEDSHYAVGSGTFSPRSVDHESHQTEAEEEMCVQDEDSKFSFAEECVASTAPLPPSPASSVPQEPVVKEEEEVPLKQLEQLTIESAPWLDQPLLRPPGRRRWRVRCDKLEDWKDLIESLRGSTLSKEKHLHDLLAHSFLPEIEKFYVQKEQEKSQREAEMIRRISERLETKRSLRERPAASSVNALRDFISSGEEDRESTMSEERKRQLEIESREQRYRSRVMEKEKQERLRERAREERARRLQARLQRQQGEVGVKTEGSFMDDRTLSELDIQLELEFMYGQLEKLIFALKESSDAWPFLEPVTEDIAPGYFEVIKEPMDLSLIETKLMSRHYKNRLEFVQDVNLMLVNCLEYNGLKNDYTKVAQRLERTFIRLWKRYFPVSRTNEEDTSLDCVALLGALDAKIKEKVREELMLSRPVLTPQVPPPRRASRSYNLSEPSGIPLSRYVNSRLHHRVARDFARPISINPTVGAVSSPLYRPIAPRHLLQNVPGVSSQRPVLIRLSAEQQQQQQQQHSMQGRRPSVPSHCAYLINAVDGHRLVRFVMPDGGFPSEALVKPAVSWLRQHAELLPKTFTMVTILDKTPSALEERMGSPFMAGSRLFPVNENISLAFTPVESSSSSMNHGSEPPKLQPIATANMPTTSFSPKNVLLVQSNSARAQAYGGPPALSAAVSDAPTSSCTATPTRVLPRVTSKPICSVAPLRSSADGGWAHCSPPELVPATAVPTSSAGTSSSSAAPSAPIALCDQTIVVLSAKQVIVGDSGCYIVNSSTTPSSTTVGSDANEQSTNQSSSVQIIQVVPAGMVITSSASQTSGGAAASVASSTTSIANSQTQ